MLRTNAQHYINELCKQNNIKNMKLIIINDNTINATASPSKDTIKVSSYILSHLPNNQIKALLAHEVGHKVIYHHDKISPYVLSFLLFVTLFITATFLSQTIITSYICDFIFYEIVNSIIAKWLECRADEFAEKETSLNDIIHVLNTANTQSTKHYGIIKRSFHLLFGKHPYLNTRIKHLLFSAK